MKTIGVILMLMVQGATNLHVNKFDMMLFGSGSERKEKKNKKKNPLVAMYMTITCIFLLFDGVGRS